MIRPVGVITTPCASDAPATGSSSSIPSPEKPASNVHASSNTANAIVRFPDADEPPAITSF